MAIKLLKNNEINLLKNNNFVESVNSRNVRFTEEFKKIFYEMYMLGYAPSTIFKQCGISPKILGTSRIYSFTNRIIYSGHNDLEHKDKKYCLKIKLINFFR